MILEMKGTIFILDYKSLDQSSLNETFVLTTVLHTEKESLKLSLSMYHWILKPFYLSILKCKTQIGKQECFIFIAN